MQGDVYTGLGAESFSEEDFTFAQTHLRILSGLYGVLRPLDLMQPYRLEMGSRLANEAGRDLYAFWGDTITDALNEDLEAQGDDTLVNLASNEYFKAVKPRRLRGRVVTPQFKEPRDEGYRMIGLFARKARGLMSRYVIRNRLADVEGLREFAADGYAYNEPFSTGSQWVFTRG